MQELAREFGLSMEAFLEMREDEEMNSMLFEAMEMEQLAEVRESAKFVTDMRRKMGMAEMDDMRGTREYRIARELLDAVGKTHNVIFRQSTSSPTVSVFLMVETRTIKGISRKREFIGTFRTAGDLILWNSADENEEMQEFTSPARIAIAIADMPSRVNMGQALFGSRLRNKGAKRIADETGNAAAGFGEDEELTTRVTRQGKRGMTPEQKRESAKLQKRARRLALRILASGTIPAAPKYFTPEEKWAKTAVIALDMEKAEMLSAIPTSASKGETFAYAARDEKGIILTESGNVRTDKSEKPKIRTNREERVIPSRFPVSPKAPVAPVAPVEAPKVNPRSRKARKAL